MEAIVRILTDPSAWVSNIIFGLATTLIWKCFPAAKTLLTRRFRAFRLKRLRKLRAARDSLGAVHFAIGKATALQTSFINLCFFYVFAIVISEPYRALLNWSITTGLILASPILIFELFWLSYDSFAESLVKENRKLTRYRMPKNAA
jgi:hypothetical protein